MLGDISRAEQIYIACGHTDMRKSIDGLAAIVQQNFKLNPFQNSLFLFCGRRRDRIKALYWEGDGFVLLYKRLENGKFQWPKDAEAVRRLSPQEFRWLLEGLSIDQPKAVKKLNIRACI
jgi:transposase